MTERHYQQGHSMVHVCSRCRAIIPRDDAHLDCPMKPFAPEPSDSLPVAGGSAEADSS